MHALNCSFKRISFVILSHIKINEENSMNLHGDDIVTPWGNDCLINPSRVAFVTRTVRGILLSYNILQGIVALELTDKSCNVCSTVFITGDTVRKHGGSLLTHLSFSDSIRTALFVLCRVLCITITIII